MTCPLNGKIDIGVANRLFPIVYPRTVSGGTVSIVSGSRQKVPYYGIEGIIVSSHCGVETRGVRIGKGRMGNMCSVDLQVGGKNIHFKLSHTLQLTGALSEEMGALGFSTLVAHILKLQSHMDYISELPSDLRDRTVNWVREVSRGDPVPIVEGAPTLETVLRLSNDGGSPVSGVASPTGSQALRGSLGLQSHRSENDIAMLQASGYDFLINELSPELMKRAPDDIDKVLATILLVYSPDFKFGKERYHSAYMKKIDYILTCPYVCDRHLSCGKPSVSNGVYNYKLGVSIEGSQLAIFLHERGYQATFMNWVSRAARVSIPIGNRDPPVYHRFEINVGGSVRQTSPTCHAEAIAAHKLVMRGINEYVIQRDGNNSALRYVPLDDEVDEPLEDELLDELSDEIIE